MPKLEYKNYKHHFEVKAQGDNFQVEGYASVFNVKDNHGEIISPGAYKNASRKRKIAFLWQYDQTKPIGVIDEIYEDEKGIFMKATINGTTQNGRDAISLIEQGAIEGFSVGFYVKKCHLSKSGERVITEMDLVEVSLVTFPSNEQALITDRSKKSFITIQPTKEDNMTTHTNNADEGRFQKIEKSIYEMQSAMVRPDIDMAPVLETKFGHFLRTGTMDLETKALTSNADQDGGFMLRPELYDRIVAGIKAMSPMRQLASVETISSNALDVLIERGRFASNWVADAAVRVDTDNAQVAQKRISVHELYAQPKATQRLLDDSAINIENWVAERLEDSFARIENTSFINGDGNNKPTGILNYANDVVNRIDVGTPGEIHIPDIQHLINALDEYYLPNASFLMHRTTLAAIQALRDDNGRFLWQPSLSEKAPGTLFGIPVVASSDMPNFRQDNLGIILADFKAGYKIVDKVGIHSLRDQYTEKPFVKFYTVKRVGGDVVDAAAIKVLKL